MDDTSDSDDALLCSTEHLYVTKEISYKEEDEVEYEAWMSPTTTSISEAGSVDIDSCNLSKENVIGKANESVTKNWVNMKDIKLEDVADIRFEDIEAAGKFYNCYAYAHGFSTRKNRISRFQDSDLVRGRDWVCSKAGVSSTKVANPIQPNKGKEVLNLKKRKRARHLPRGYRRSRCGCGATFAVKWCNIRKSYYVSSFVTDHNHHLFSGSEVCFFRSHRKVETHDIAQVESLVEVQVPISGAYEFIHSLFVNVVT